MAPCLGDRSGGGGETRAGLCGHERGNAEIRAANLDGYITTADFYALQGDPSKAIEWLQLAVSRGDERIAYFRRNPRLATLQNEPRFQSLLKSVEARKMAK